MKILFTRSKSPLSWLIRAVTREPVSHCAVLYNGLVAHSNLLGLHLTGENHFRETTEVVYEVTIPSIDQHEDHQKFWKLLDEEEGSLYDFGALLFLGFCLILRSIFKIPLPKSNLWAASGMFVCTEWVTEVVSEEEDAMITPYGLYLKLKE